MTISGLCHSNSVTNFGFKWVSNRMKYLGIKLSQDVEEIPAFNLEPVLQKIKNNYKWGKIRLTLWGKVNVIKMVISPQFSYILMRYQLLYLPTSLNNIIR